MILVDTSVWIEVFRRSRPFELEAVVLEAAALYRNARRVGLALRSSTDCLIAACAWRHDLAVLHRDRDIAAIAQVAPLLHRPI